MSLSQKTRALFIGYSILLVWGILFKLDIWSTLQQAQYSTFRSINLIPFAGTAVYNGHLDWWEIGLNVLAFVPLGLFLEMLRKQAEWVSQLVIVGLVSLGFEVLQYAFHLGVADMTDLLGNGLGGALGILLYYIVSSIWRDQTENRLHLPLLCGMVLTLLYAFVTGF